MLTIILRERGAPQPVDRETWRRLRLGTSVRALADAGVLRVEHSRSFAMIYPSHFVGVLRTPQFQLHVIPKDEDFFRCLERLSLEFVGKKARLFFDRDTSDDGDDLTSAFYRSLVSVLDEGFPWQYEGSSTATSYPRGHLEMRGTVSALASRGINHRVIARRAYKVQREDLCALVRSAFFALSSFSGTNPRLINSAGLLLEALDAGMPRLLPELREVGNRMLGDDSLSPSAKALAATCLAILELGDAQGALLLPVQDGLAAFHNLETLWERAVALLVGRTPCLVEDAVTCLHGLFARKLSLFPDGGPELDPDVIVSVEGNVRGIVDAKYKAVTGSSAPPAADVYQMTCYLERTNACWGYLVYFGSEDGVHKVGTAAGGAPLLKVTLSPQTIAKLGADSLHYLLTTPGFSDQAA